MADGVDAAVDPMQGAEAGAVLSATGTEANGSQLRE